MAQRSAVRAAVATAAVLAIALSMTSIQRQREEADSARGASAVIRQQLAAFRQGDYPGAYRHAAPEIQEQFPLPAFRRMVKEGYPKIAHSRAASFGTPVSRGDVLEVPVTVTGEDGATTDVLYWMLRVEGRWRVKAVLGGGPPGSGSGSPGAPPPAEKRQKEPDAARIPTGTRQS